MKQKIKKCIENLTSGWYREIQECKKYNCGFNGNIGKVGEILSACMLNSMCTGTSGMGYDLWDTKLQVGDEVKSVFILQPKSCKKCGCKVNYFLNVCPECGSKNFNSLNDTRFNIRSTAHIEYFDNLRYYLFHSITPNDNDNLYEVLWETWIIDKDEKYFDDLLRNQNKNSTTKSVNLLPYTYDFYMSKPRKIFESIVDFSSSNPVCDILYFDINGKEELMPIDLLQKTKELPLLKLTEDVEYIDVDYLYEVGLWIRNKKFNKDRGIVTRRGNKINE